MEPSPILQVRRPERLPKFVILALALYAVLLGWSATRHSPTWDEPGHLVAGWSHWKFGRFELYSVNPPLVRSLAAIPIWVANPEMDWGDFEPNPQKRSEVNLGRQLIQRYGDDAVKYLIWGRWACIPLCLLGALVCYFWADNAFGRPSAWMAMSLWMCSPLLLGHGELITPDVGATSIGLAATYQFRRWLQTPGWRGVTGCGVLLGLSWLSKTTLLLLLPAWLIAWCTLRSRYRAASVISTWRSELAQGLGMTLLGLLLLNGFYAFRGTGTALSGFAFMSHVFSGAESGCDVVGNRFVDSWLGSLPVPFPQEFIAGIDIQLRDFERGLTDVAWGSYWHGEWKLGGWWFFYVTGFLVKEPLGLWVLLTVTVLLKLIACRSLLTHEDAFLAIPFMVILWVVSAQIGMSRHLRYVFPAYPYLLLFVSQSAGCCFSKARRADIQPAVSVAPETASPLRSHSASHLSPSMMSQSSEQSFSPKWKWPIGVAWAWFIFCGLWSTPHSLAYFNEFAECYSNDVRWLIGSNFDWGQDLYELRKWQRVHPEATPLRFAYFGPIDPQWLGIEYQLPPALPRMSPSQTGIARRRLELEPGWYAISETILAGDLMPVPDSEGTFRYFGEPVFHYLQSVKPTARIGRTILLYHFEAKSRQRFITSQ